MDEKIEDVLKTVKRELLDTDTIAIDIRCVKLRSKPMQYTVETTKLKQTKL